MIPGRKTLAIRQFVGGALLLLAALGIMGALPALCSCAEAISHEAAAAGYEAQQMRCVEQYATRAEIDRCRAKVKLAWMTGDAGADASTEGGDR